MPIFECDQCGFSAKTYRVWRKHLLGRRGSGHPAKAREHWLNWTQDEIDRSVVVFGLLAVKKSDVINYFGDLGFFISDFVFWNDREDFCIIQFLIPSILQKLASQKHVICGKELFVRLHKDISKPEWVSFCPFLATNLDVGKIEVEDVDMDESDEVQSIIEVNCSENEIVMNDESAEVSEEVILENMWNAQMDDLYTVNLMHPEEWNCRNHVKDDLQQLIRTKFPHAILIPFAIASYAISSGNGPARLNIFVDIKGNTSKRSVESGGTFSMDVPQNTLDDLKTELISLLRGCSSVSNIAVSTSTADVLGKDEIQFNYIKNQSQLTCRINLDNFLAVQSSRIIQYMCSLDPRVRPLIIVARHWAFHNNLVQSNPGEMRQESECFRPAAIQWLVLFFLGHKGIIPSVSTLQRFRTTTLNHRSWDLGFCSDPQAIGWSKKNDYELDPLTGNPSAKCILMLFTEMLQYFGTTGFSKVLFSTNSARLLRTTKKRLRRGLCQDETAVNDGRKLVLYSARNKSLCLQHPLRLDNNMTQNVSDSVLKVFTKTCLGTGQMLQELLNGIGGPQSCNVVDLLGSINNAEVTEESNIVTTETPMDQFLMQRLFILPAFRKTYKSPIAVLTPNLNNRIEEWLKVLMDFNSLVWPICFGVRLTQLRGGRRNPKRFNQRFKGVLIKPEKLQWSKCDQSEDKNKRKKAERKKILSLCTMLRNAKQSPTADPQEDDEDENMVQLTPGGFTFECQIKRACKKSKKTGVFFKFKFRGLSTETLRRVMQMFISLWEWYSIQQLLSPNDMQLPHK